MLTRKQKESLRQGIVDLGLNPDELPLPAFHTYLEELDRWNKAYNLTAVRDIDGMITYHLLDSLSALPFIQGNRCIDVGTGAGLPGMILALALPEVSWVLLDSRLKKTRFLQHILQEIKPGNIEVVQSRAEDYCPDQLFDTVITRALTSLTDFCELCSHLMNEGGQLLAMKGKYPEIELSELSVGDSAVHELSVPGLKSDRFLIIIK